MLLLKREYDRVKTFQNLNLDEKKSIKLARSGFFYTNCKDTIKCYFCSLEMSALNCPSNVEAEHLRLSPNCVYANGEDECGPFKQPAAGNFTRVLSYSIRILGGGFIIAGLFCEIYLLYLFFKEKL